MARKAELPVEISANIGPFERAIHAATGKAREFKKSVGEVGKDIGKELGGSEFSKLIGSVDAMTVAAGLFGAAIVKAAKDGFDKFSEFEQLTLKIKNNLANPDLAPAIMEKIEKTSGAAGTPVERATAYTTLLEAGIQPGEEGNEEATEKNSIGGVTGAHMEGGVTVLPSQGAELPDKGAMTILNALDQWSARTGESQSQMADTLRMIHAGGADSGEGMSRALRSFKGLDLALAPQLAAFQAKQAPEQVAAHLEAVEKLTDYRKRHATGNISGFQTQTEANEYAKLKKESDTKAPLATTADMLKEHALKFSDITDAIVSGAPKGAVEDEGKTWKGHVDVLMLAFDTLEKAIGTALAPDLELMMGRLTDALPGVTEKFTEVAHEIETGVIPVLEAFTAALADAAKTESEALAKAGKSEMEHLEDLHANKQMDDQGNIISSAYKGQQGGTIGDLLTDQWQMTVFKAMGMKLPDFGAQGVANTRMSDTGRNPNVYDDHTSALIDHTDALNKNSDMLLTPGDVQ